MNESKHTPGPWKAVNLEFTNGDFEIQNNEYLICRLNIGGMSESEQVDRKIADARLIASAPELLEAIQDVTALFLDSSVRELENKKIIKPNDEDNEMFIALCVLGWLFRHPKVEKLRAIIAKAKGE